MVDIPMNNYDLKAEAKKFHDNVEKAIEIIVGQLAEHDHGVITTCYEGGSTDMFPSIAKAFKEKGYFPYYGHNVKGRLNVLLIYKHPMRGYYAQFYVEVKF